MDLIIFIFIVVTIISKMDHQKKASKQQDRPNQKQKNVKKEVKKERKKQIEQPRQEVFESVIEPSPVEESTVKRSKKKEWENTDYYSGEQPKYLGIRGDVNLPKEGEKMVYCDYCGAENIIPRGKKGYHCYFCWQKLN